MNTKYVNWHTFKLVVIWLLSIQMSKLSGLDLDQQYSAIMSATPFISIGSILLFLGVSCDIQHKGYWVGTTLTLLLAFNIYSWLIPFPLSLSNVQIAGVAVINLATITTMYQYYTSTMRIKAKV
jgi:hypothetical protein